MQKRIAGAPAPNVPRLVSRGRRRALYDKVGALSRRSTGARRRSDGPSRAARPVPRSHRWRGSSIVDARRRSSLKLYLGILVPRVRGSAACDERSTREHVGRASRSPIRGRGGARRVREAIKYLEGLNLIRLEGRGIRRKLGSLQDGSGMDYTMPAMRPCDDEDTTSCRSNTTSWGSRPASGAWGRATLSTMPSQHGWR